MTALSKPIARSATTLISHQHLWPRNRKLPGLAHGWQGSAWVAFKLAGAGHPIIPVMLGDASLAQEMANRLLKEGIYVIGFSYPVVPKGEDEIRFQINADHTEADIDEVLRVLGTYNK